MKCKVYRALDKPQVFFGIKGRFITWYLILAGVVLMLLMRLMNSFLKKDLTIQYLNYHCH